MAVTELKGGLFINNAAMALAIRLEAAGHVLSAKDDALLVSNGSTLSAEDRAAIRAHKLHLLAIVTYCAPEIP